MSATISTTAPVELLSLDDLPSSLAAAARTIVAVPGVGGALATKYKAPLGSGTVGPPGPPGLGFTFRGAWAANTAYAVGDVVTNGGQTYECSVAFTSVGTFNASNWNLWAAKGADGVGGGGGTIPPASGQLLGGSGTAGTAAAITVGSGLSLSSGTLSVSYTYTLPTATATQLGGVKVGTGLLVAGDGTVSVDSVSAHALSAGSGIAAADEVATFSIAGNADVKYTMGGIASFVRTSQGLARLSGDTFTGGIGVSFAALTDAASITTDGIVNLGNFFTVTLGGNRALAAPTNLRPGSYTYFIKQDATGNRTLSFPDGAVFINGGVAPTLSTAAGKEDTLTLIWNGTTPRYAFVKGS